MSGDLYQKWRESEAYAVPMTEDGVKLSQHRWRGFNMGYKQAMKDAVDLLMVQHEAENREWVGLTDDEIDNLRDETVGLSPLIRAVEAKLKEKNT